MQGPVEEVQLNDPVIQLTESMNREVDNFINAMHDMNHKDHKQAVGTYLFIRAVVERISKVDNSETLMRFAESQPDEICEDAIETPNNQPRADNISLDDDGYNMAPFDESL